MVVVNNDDVNVTPVEFCVSPKLVPPLIRVEFTSWLPSNICRTSLRISALVACKPMKETEPCEPDEKSTSPRN